MPGTNGHASGSPRDGGIAAILAEIRDLRREAREDRRRSDARFAGWQRQAAEDRRQAEADRREAGGDRKGIVELLARMDDHLASQGKTLVRIESGQRALMHAITGLGAGQRALRDAITDLTRTLRPPRNGRNGGNGRHRK